MQLSDPRQEAFAIHVAAGASKSEAARLAGYGKGQGNAGSRASRLPRVAARIEELKQASTPAEPLDQSEKWISKPGVIMELVSVHKLAKSKAQYSVCISALLALAKIGKLIDVGTPGPKSVTQVNVSGFTSAQMNQLIKQNFGVLPDAERKAIAASYPEVLDVNAEPAITDPATNADTASE